MCVFVSVVVYVCVFLCLCVFVCARGVVEMRRGASVNSSMIYDALQLRERLLLWLRPIL